MCRTPRSEQGRSCSGQHGRPPSAPLELWPRPSPPATQGPPRVSSYAAVKLPDFELNKITLILLLVIKNKETSEISVSEQVPGHPTDSSKGGEVLGLGFPSL